MSGGSLDLDFPRQKFSSMRMAMPTGLTHSQDESHQLIENSCAANEAVARLTRFEPPALALIASRDPDEEKLAEFRRFLTTLASRWALVNRDERVKLLAGLKITAKLHLRTQLLRSMRKACYRASPDGHYGLNKPDYTHFTSRFVAHADLCASRVRHYLVSISVIQPESATPGYRASHTTIWPNI